MLPSADDSLHVLDRDDSRGGSRISERGGGHMYKCVWVRFADFDLIFLKCSMKMKYFGLIETKLFHFHRIFEKGGRGV